MKYEVTVTRIKTEISSFEVSARNAEDAEVKVRSKIEPYYGPNGTIDDPAKIEKAEKAALRYFEDHLNETADHTTEYEYEVETN